MAKHYVTVKVVDGGRSGPYVEEATRWVRSKSKKNTMVLKRLTKSEVRDLLERLTK